MAIVDEDIQRVREATDSVAVIGAHVGLRRVGRRWTGLCPFHNEKSPSFSVNAEEGLYHCFGCKASGDIIRFVQEVEGLDFPGAVERLADKAGITLRYTEAGQSERRQRSSVLHDLLEQAVDFYHRRLLESADAGAARAYLRARGYDGDVVRRFRIGWAPDDWDAVARSLKASRSDLEAAGLAFQNRRGRMQDSFRARVMFPVFDVSGRAVGFGGRILPGAEGPKYKNSQQGPVYDKSRLLYGLNWAKAPAVERQRVVICEGYTDVIAFARAGVTEAVATCGTALTEDHVKLLRRFARRLVLAFDADSAGQGAAERVYAWERTHDLEVTVVTLAEGRDPGDVGAEDPDALVAAVDEATPFLGWRIDRILSAESLDTPERRARVAHRALDAVAEHPDEFVRDPYVMTVADRTGVDAARLRTSLAEVLRRPRRVRPEGGSRSGPRPADRPSDDGPPLDHYDRLAGAAGPEIEPGEPMPVEVPVEIGRSEMEALRVLAHRRAEIIGRLNDGMFPTPVAAAAFGQLVAAPSLREALDDASPEVASLLHRVAVEETDAEVDGVLVPLVRVAAEQAVTSLTRRYAGTDELRQHAPLIQWLNGRLAELTDEHTQTAAVASLADWLGQWRAAA